MNYPYDDTMTTDPHDQEVCDEHQAFVPCPLCQFEAEMARWESGQEEAGR
jgi:hypothetical protein